MTKGHKRLSRHGVLGVWPDVRRLEAQHDIGFGDARLFYTFGNPQIGIVSLKPNFIIDDLKADYRPVNAPRTIPTFPQNQVIIRLAIKNGLVSQPGGALIARFVCSTIAVSSRSMMLRYRSSLSIARPPPCRHLDARAGWNA